MILAKKMELNLKRYLLIMILLIIKQENLSIKNNVNKNPLQFLLAIIIHRFLNFFKLGS